MLENGGLIGTNAELCGLFLAVDASKARTMASISTALAACLRAYSGFSNSSQKSVRASGRR